MAAGAAAIFLGLRCEAWSDSDTRRDSAGDEFELGLSDPDPDEPV